MDKSMKRKVSKFRNEKSIEKIIDYLHTNERPLAWLQRQTGIDYNTLYSIFSQRVVGLSDEKRKLINEKLKTKF
jgi:hypothetical protein